MNAMHRPEDLLDQVMSKLEQIRSVTWSVVDQVDRLCQHDDVKQVVSGEVGLIYSQLVETQSLVDQLSSEVQRPRV